MVYGVLNGLHRTVEFAHQERIKVILIAWLGENRKTNNASIKRAIRVAKGLSPDRDKGELRGRVANVPGEQPRHQ